MATVGDEFNPTQSFCSRGNQIKQPLDRITCFCEDGGQSNESHGSKWEFCIANKWRRRWRIRRRRRRRSGNLSCKTQSSKNEMKCCFLFLFYYEKHNKTGRAFMSSGCSMQQQQQQQVSDSGKNALAHPQRRKIGDGRGAFGDKLQRWGVNPAQVSLCLGFFLLLLHPLPLIPVTPRRQDPS